MARLGPGDRLRALLIFRLLLRLFIKNDAVVRVFRHGMGASVSFAGVECIHYLGQLFAPKPDGR